MILRYYSNITADSYSSSNSNSEDVVTVGIDPSSCSNSTVVKSYLTMTMSDDGVMMFLLVSLPMICFVSLGLQVWNNYYLVMSLLFDAEYK